MTQSRYPIPAHYHRSEIEVERSRFITSIEHAETPETAHDFISRIKQEFPNANHNCWAYLAGPPGSSDKIGMSDDGEPHGSAGKPMLTVLQHSGVGEIVVTVTRFFGGIKLGKGGMVKAYTKAVLSALELLESKEKIDWRELLLDFDYSLLNQIERLLPQLEAVIIDKDFSAQITIHCKVPVENESILRQKLIDLAAARITFRPAE